MRCLVGLSFFSFLSLQVSLFFWIVIEDCLRTKCSTNCLSQGLFPFSLFFLFSITEPKKASVSCPSCSLTVWIFPCLSLFNLSPLYVFTSFEIHQ